MGRACERLLRPGQGRTKSWLIPEQPFGDNSGDQRALDQGSGAGGTDISAIAELVWMLLFEVLPGPAYVWRRVSRGLQGLGRT